ncbi:hypothetical protein JVT61DRAFT_12572 [Boletus reticuloceps]|uniref:Uncharacterized protein n=1 Tax=Boletus reticuloceps TaxID=495285 RepID=A0A8I3A3E6_9AGAM|nr:hypothetical protein JVT61DRAFT_12572 [Boletus reticuloceps]
MTAVMIWDTMTLAVVVPSRLQTSPWAHFRCQTSLATWTGYSALYIAIGRVHADHTSAVIYSVPLPSLRKMNTTRAITSKSRVSILDNEMLKHMDRTRAVFCYDRPYPFNSINSIKRCVSYVGSCIASHRHAYTSVERGHILRFCGPYILCFRVRAVEAYPIPTNPPQPIPSPCFGTDSAPSASAPYPSPTSACRTARRRVTSTLSTCSPTTSTKACSTTASASPRRLYLPCRCASLRGEYFPVGAPAAHAGTETRYTLEDIIRRMFVSTWSLGSAGCAGCGWIGREGASIGGWWRLRRTRVGCGARRREWTDEDASDEPPTMDGKVVHVISSYDLQGTCLYAFEISPDLECLKDDVTSCAVSEWTGRIALGSRIGAISLL